MFRTYTEPTVKWAKISKHQIQRIRECTRSYDDIFCRVLRNTKVATLSEKVAIKCATLHVKKIPVKLAYGSFSPKTTKWVSVCIKRCHVYIRTGLYATVHKEQVYPMNMKSTNFLS